MIIPVLLLLFLDFLWIWLYMGGKYSQEISRIQGSPLKPRLFFAVLAYLLMVIGLLVFVLPNIRKDHALVDSLKYGALFGIVLYGVYDFTAATVFKDWNIKLALVDILWGGFVYFIVAYVTTKMNLK